VTFAAASKKLKNLGYVLVALVVVGTLTNCSSTPSPEDHADEIYSANDPFEDINRVTFALNQAVDGVFLKPIAEVYVGVVPQWGRNRVNDALNNLGEPVNFANAMLQWELERAATSMLRFAFNSTIGLGGFFDIAEGIGLSRAAEDFGQTLAIWGVGEGPYLVLPLFGPSNPRDAVGMGADWLLDPFSRALRSHERIQRFAARGIDQRSRHIDDLETLEDTSIDFYSAFRELYRQYRLNEIRNGELPPPLPIPSITLEEFSEEEFDQVSVSGQASEE
jgi:phospholipid-binding lipoprotein MlaA